MLRPADDLDQLHGIRRPQLVLHTPSSERMTIQRALTAETWPQDGAVRVRIGIHTGEPIRTTEGYTGLDVIRGARIKEAGHGGQALLPAATTAIVQHALLDEFRPRHLGEYRLHSLPPPGPLFQLLIPGLPSH